MKTFFTGLLDCFIIVIFMAAFIRLLFIFIPHDNSDNPETYESSGFAVYTDHLTGCQYLRAGLFSSVTPRLDGDKNQVGCR